MTQALLLLVILIITAGGLLGYFDKYEYFESLLKRLLSRIREGRG
jgi:uncharacterized membrane protein (UPF0136 family)